MMNRPIQRWKVVVGFLMGLLLIGPGQVGKAETADDSRSVTGTVTDSQGSVVKDAIVIASYRDGSMQSHSLTATTDSAGVYQLEVPARLAADLQLVVWKQGHGVGLGTKFSTAAQHAVPLQLPNSTPLTLRVRDAEGEVAAGVTIKVYGFIKADGRQAGYSGKGGFEHLNCVANESGVAVLDFLPAELGVSLAVESAGGVRQMLYVSRKYFADELDVQLLPTGRVHVALAASDGSEMAGRKLVLSTRHLPTAEDSREKPDENNRRKNVKPIYCSTEVVTNDAGTAQGVVGIGQLTINLPKRDGDRLYAVAPTEITVEAGTTRDVTVPLEPGVQIHGRVVTDRDAPVAGVELSIGNVSVQTDADGRYEGTLAPQGYAQGRLVNVPLGYVRPFDEQLPIPRSHNGKLEVDQGKNEIELPVIRLKQAVPITGLVVDEQDQPIPQVQVKAAWVQTHETESYFTLKSETAQTNDQGKFALNRVLGDVDVRVTAQNEDAAMLSAETITTDGPQELRLQVSPAGMVTISGVAVGVDGGPVGGATVKISRANLAPNGHNYGTRPISWQGETELGTDDRGRFYFPGVVPRFGKYSISVASKGYLPVETPYCEPPATGDILDVGEIELTQTRSITGVVRDLTGQPVPDVLVWSYGVMDARRRARRRVESRTDQDGHFSLETLHPRAAIAIAEKTGYRTVGAPLLLQESEVTMVLTPLDQPWPSNQVVAPRDMPDLARHEAAKQLLEVMLPRRRNANYHYNILLNALARIDTDATLVELEVANNASARAEALAAMGELADAQAEVESIGNAYSRAFARFKLLKQVENVEGKRQMLSAALVDSGQIQRPDRRLVVVAQISSELVLLGDTQQAAELLRAEMSQAQQLSTNEWAGYARASFAERLALFESEVALKMIGEADTDDQHRHYRNLAHTVAASDPALAEQALARIVEHRYIDDPAVRVAYRMAPIDLPRALGLLEKIDTQRRPVAKANGLGVIAMAIRDTQPDRAAELLQQAFDALPQQRANSGSRSAGIFGAATTLLRFAESIDPGQLTDYYWRALSRYPGPDAGAWSPEDAAEQNAERQALLALIVARYDRMPELPPQIVAPVFTFWQQQIGSEKSRFTDRRGSIMAMALVDPKQTAQWAVEFDEKLSSKRRRHIPQPWEVVVDTLTSDRDSIGEKITNTVYHHWVIGEYDF